MNLSDHLIQQHALLKIRRAAYRRNSMIAAGVFIFSLLGALIFGLLAEWNPREFILTAGLNVVLLISFLMSWVRLAIIQSQIELLDLLADRPDRLSEG
jgi:flagellar biosynthesis protein FliR